MKPEKLSDIKKELSGLSVQELTEICLRIAKYKKENKELLNYLLFDANDPLAYAEAVKSFLEEDFKTLQKHYYHSTKSLRKIIRLMNRYAKYTASRQVDIEMALWFCSNFLLYADLKSSHKPLQGLLIRQLEKISKLLPKLHEDLQFDYQSEFEELLHRAENQARWISKSLYL
ncbi:MAG: hypothetical protein ACO1NS_10175 [Daejeonella sp.]|uniref:hypothetical protein n=1 Tax=Daejeonella sp. JGW-45 TaxID=3034148 RepID=UPI0023EBFD25|nr:hypothetical protein [Daejeonella sp. JGW-45]